MKKYYWLFLIIVIIIMIIIGIFSIRSNNHSNAMVLINDHQFSVEVASTESQREQGLMNRTELNVDSGMLFKFPKSDIYTIWMKNTKIPLDVIWINDDKIVEIATLDPQTTDDIPQQTAQSKANYILEINAGLADQYNFKIGDKVSL